MVDSKTIGRELLPGEFIMLKEDGSHISSIEDHQTFIQDRPLINAPVRKIIRKEASKRSGFITMDTKEYHDSKLELTLFTEALEGESYYSKREVIFDMFNEGGYVKVLFYFDPSKVYKVMLDDEAAQFENKYYYEDGQSWRVNLTVHPWKELVDTEDYKIRTPSELVNPSLYDSKPLIKIVGKGKMNLVVNGLVFKMGEIPSSGIVLDSETSNAYVLSQEGRVINLNEYVFTREFPIFKPGKNTIDWELDTSGIIEEIIIEPRWRTII